MLHIRQNILICSVNTLHLSRPWFS